MKHPQIHNRFQTFLAHHNLLTLLAIYVLMTVGFSLIIGLLWTLIGKTDTPFASEFLWKSWYSFVFIYGYQPEISPLYTQLSSIVAVPLSIAGLAFPTLLLGSIVFKLLMPGSKMVIFRESLSLDVDNGLGSLCIHYYLGTEMPIVNLSFKVFARTYTKSLIRRFPLRTHDLFLGETLPLPFTRVPTEFSIPVRVSGKNDNADATAQLVFEKNNERLTLKEVCNMEIDDNTGDRCELIVVVTGMMPKLGVEFTEFHQYSIPEAIRYGEKFEIFTEFDSAKGTITVEGWETF